MNTKQDLKDIILQAQLDDQDKELWNKFIEVNEEENLNDIVELLKNEPERLEFLTDNLREKLDAFLNRDSDKLNNIVETEIKAIKDLGE